MSLPPLPAGLSLTTARRDDPVGATPPRRRERPRDVVRLRTGERVRLEPPTGAAHDGDTFKLRDGTNARLFGVDAFELDQTGRARDGAAVPLGAEARRRLLDYAQPDAQVRGTGSVTYGRPVATLDRGGDAATALLDQGLGIATPEYLRRDPARLNAYMEAERLARLNRRGAWQTQFEQPSSFRHGTPDPWAQPVPGKQGESQAVFWDEPTPFQGLRPEIAAQWLALHKDPTSTADEIIAFAKTNGFNIDPASAERFVANRDAQPGRKISDSVVYGEAPRILTDAKDGALGAATRGFADPINMLDEMGAVVDALGGTAGRENIWNSDRRFGDILGNNLDQNRSVLAYDDANHPYARFGGQLAGGLVVPAGAAEGAGIAAARGVLEAGGTRFAADQAARSAVVTRLATAGAIEGAAAGIGQGETWQERAQGGLIGAPLGAALGAGTGLLAPTIAAAGRKAIDFSSSKLTSAARRAIRQRRGLDPETGRFGTIHYDLASPKRWGKALERMREDDSGEIPAAIHHPEIGNIDLVWGTNGFGVKHIAERHPEVLDDLPRIVEGLPVKQRPGEVGNNRFVLENDTHRAVVAPDYDGETKRWVVTAYQKKGKASEGADLSPRSPVPDGGSTSAEAGPDVVAAEPLSNPPPAPLVTVPSGQSAGPLARPREPVSANIAAVDEASGLGPKSMLGVVPRTGRPGVEVINQDGHLALAVYRDSQGAAQGVAQIPLTPEARELFDNASVYVAPSFRRQGVGASLYDALEREGFPIGEQSGRGDLTPDGAGFVSAWRVRGGEPSRVPMAPSQRELVVNGLRAHIDAETAARRAARDPGNAGEPAAPLLADATDAARAAQAERIAPSDVLPIPANTVASLEEAERIAAGRVERVRAPDEMQELERRAIPSAATGTPLPKRGPLDLVTWLRTKGGLRDQGGELRHYGIDNSPRRGVDFAGGEQRFGPLVSPEGMTHDDAALAAWEAGFFPDHVERPTADEFLDALGNTYAGSERRFRLEDADEIERFERTRQERFDVEQAAQEGNPLYRDRGQPISLDDLEHNTPPVEAYEEWGENAPNLAGNLRLDRLDSPQAIKRALVATHNRVGGFDAATRGRITHAETESLAADLGMTADGLLKRRKGQAFNAEEALAARQILARSATDLVNMARRVQRSDNPGEELEAAFKQAWLRHVAIQEQVSGATAEAGRALQAFRMAAEAKAVDRVLPSLGDIAGGAARLKDVADKLVDLELTGVGPGGINQFAAKALKPRFRDKLVELYYNSLLSGPQTHAVNILSNTLTALGQVPEHAAAAAIGAARKALPRQRDTDRVLFSELGARSAGLIQGAREGLRQAARTFATGEPLDAVTKVEQQTQRAIGGIKGSVVRTPTRALAAEDELFKAMARRMELSGLAVREAAKEGLKGKAARARAADLLANPSDEMLSRSFDYGRYLTFQKPLGPVGRHISAITETWPGLKLIVPFVRTPTNILKFAIERSPAAPMLKEWRSDIAAGGARRDLAMAKVLVGTGIGATIVQMAAQGHITGGGPADDSAKRLLAANGWQPYSFKVGDRYYSYSRLDPYSTLFGTAADLVDLQSHMTDKQKQDVPLLIGTAILHNLANKTWLSGLSTAMEAINDPDRSLEQFTSRTAGAMAVPAVVAQSSRLADPVLREARGPLDRIRSRLPGASDGLAPRRDVFGQPVVSEGGLGPDIVAPIYTSTSKNDPTVAALLKAETRIGMPSRKVGSRQLTPAEYSEYQRVAGGIAKPLLDALVRDRTWQGLAEEDQQDAVDKLMKKARAGARAQLFGGGGKKAERAADRTDAPSLPAGLALNRRPRRRRALPDLPAGLTLSQ